MLSFFRNMSQYSYHNNAIFCLSRIVKLRFLVCWILSSQKVASLYHFNGVSSDIIPHAATDWDSILGVVTIPQVLDMCVFI